MFPWAATRTCSGSPSCRNTGAFRRRLHRPPRSSGGWSGSTWCTSQPRPHPIRGQQRHPNQLRLRWWSWNTRPGPKPSCPAAPQSAGETKPSCAVLYARAGAGFREHLLPVRTDALLAKRQRGGDLDGAAREEKLPPPQHDQAPHLLAEVRRALCDVSKWNHGLPWLWQAQPPRVLEERATGDVSSRRAAAIQSTGGEPSKRPSTV